MGHAHVVTQNVMEEKYFARDIKTFHHGDTEARRKPKTFSRRFAQMIADQERNQKAAKSRKQKSKTSRIKDKQNGSQFPVRANPLNPCSSVVSLCRFPISAHPRKSAAKIPRFSPCLCVSVVKAFTPRLRDESFTAG
jgi:hypothetical protein